MSQRQSDHSGDDGDDVNNFLGSTCFYIARFSNKYVRELVYWTFENNIARQMANFLIDVYGRYNGQRNDNGFAYGSVQYAELQQDINNDENNTLLGFDCLPGYSKQEIANRFHNKNFPCDNKYSLHQLSFSAYYHAFENICERQDSIMLAVLNYCHAIENKSEWCCK